MALEAAVADELGQDVLLKDRYGAGVEGDPLPQRLGTLRRQHQVADTEGGRNGFGKGIEIDHAFLRLQREQGVLGFGRGGELRIEVILDDEAAAVPGPADVLVALGGAGGDAAGEAVEGCHMKDLRPGPAELSGENAVPPQPQQLALNAAAGIDLPDLLIGGVLQPVDFLPAQHLRQHGIEVLRTGSDDDLLRLHLNAPAPPEVLGNGLPQGRQTAVGALHQNVLAMLQQDMPHGSGEKRKRKMHGLRSTGGLIPPVLFRHLETEDIVLCLLRDGK